MDDYEDPGPTSPPPNLLFTGVTAPVKTNVPGNPRPTDYTL